MPIVKMCEVCKTKKQMPPSRAKYFRTCSTKCLSKLLKSPNNTKCFICNAEFYLKPHRVKRVKNQPTCSLKCNAKAKSLQFQGANNHQYGLKGHTNSSFIGYSRKTPYGYIKIYKPLHKYCDKHGRVYEHRFIVEQNHHLFDVKYFEKTSDGAIYLQPKVEVHHINHNKEDNSIENLQPLTKSEHIKEHNLLKRIIRDMENGRIVGIEKLFNPLQQCIWQEVSEEDFDQNFCNTKRGSGGFGSTGK